MEEKTCEDCIHYLRHYTKHRGIYRTVCCGHCKNKTPGSYFRKATKICECFEEKDLQKEKDEQLKTATQWLSIIGRQINEIKQLLKEPE